MIMRRHSAAVIEVGVATDDKYRTCDSLHVAAENSPLES